MKEYGKNEMKVVQINTVATGSTGSIMKCLYEYLLKTNNECYCFYGRGITVNYKNYFKFGTNFETYIHVLLTRIFDLHGHGSYFATKKLIKKIIKINPDVIQLHNLHGHYLNYKVLFKYLKNDYTGKIVWTLHDCIPFTGHCSHFVNANCFKWKSLCYNCPQKKIYPASYIFDNSKYQYKFKKKLFNGVKNMDLVVGSIWMKNNVEESFLKKYKTIVIKNGIDLETFNKIIDKNIYAKYGISNNKKIILGVSSVWNEQKGIKIFNELSKIVDDKKYEIVMVGLEKKDFLKVNENIIKIEKTSNKEDLAKIYSIADVFLNPSIEESFSFVTLEALACKTPIIVPDTTATKEFVKNNNGIVTKPNVKSYYNAIKKILNNKNKYNCNNILDEYSMLNMQKKYYNLYRKEE